MFAVKGTWLPRFIELEYEKFIEGRLDEECIGWLIKWFVLDDIFGEIYEFFKKVCGLIIISGI